MAFVSSFYNTFQMIVLKQSQDCLAMSLLHKYVNNQEWDIALIGWFLSQQTSVIKDNS